MKALTGESLAEVVYIECRFDDCFEGGDCLTVKLIEVADEDQESEDNQPIIRVARKGAVKIGLRKFIGWISNQREIFLRRNPSAGLNRREAGREHQVGL